MTVTLGPYVVGEIPAPVEYTFLDDNGVPLVDTGPMDCTFSYRLLDALPADGVQRDAVFDEDTAIATYVWTDEDLTEPGLYIGELEITNGTNDFKSVRLIWITRAAVAAATGS